MMKKMSNFIFAFILIFNLNAKNAEQIISKEFGDKNFKIKIEYKPEVVKNISGNKEQLILETITKLTKEIDPAKAAKEYIEYMKLIFEKIKSNSLFADLKECNSIEESGKKFGLIMQNLMSDISKKENVLKQSVYFSAFSDDVINEINASLAIKMQQFITDINMTVMEKTKDIQEKSVKEVAAINLEAQNTIKAKSNELFDNLIETISSVLRKHYTI